MINWKEIGEVAIKEAAAQPSVDHMRQALYRVYGDNNLNDLGDDAYVQRKFRAAMAGNRSGKMRRALEEAMRGNGMTAANGANIRPNPENVQRPLRGTPATPSVNPAVAAIEAQKNALRTLRSGRQPTPAAVPAPAPSLPNNRYGDAARAQLAAIQANRMAMQRRAAGSRALAERQSSDAIARRQALQARQGERADERARLARYARLGLAPTLPRAGVTNGSSVAGR